MDIVIVGAQKAGTSWLFSMLTQQPRIATCLLKEVHYFDSRCRPGFTFQEHRSYIKFHRKLKKAEPELAEYLQACLDEDTAFTDQWYRNLFLQLPENRKRIEAGKRPVFLEGTPSYMAMPEEGIAYMAKTLSDIEPIMVVRDPVRRMISGLTMSLAKRDDADVSQELIFKIIANNQIPRGAYSRAIPLFRKYFKGLHIIPFRDIQTRPLDLLREIETKYGLDTVDYEGMTSKVNSQTGKVQLSDDVLDRIRTVCESEYDYLRSEFGADFLDRI